jgi:hypothetical protein
MVPFPPILLECQNMFLLIWSVADVMNDDAHEIVHVLADCNLSTLVSEALHVT